MNCVIVVEDLSPVLSPTTQDKAPSLSFLPMTRSPDAVARGVVVTNIKQPQKSFSATAAGILAAIITPTCDRIPSTV